jgi:hypothetical protein
MSEFTRKGKCLYCQHHKINGIYSTCLKPCDTVRIRRIFSARDVGTYPDRYLVIAINGECDNWELKNYENV